MFKRVVFYLLILLFSAGLYSCSKYSRISKSQDFRYKYEKAMEYYEHEDYYHALNLFDQIIPFYRGTDEAEDIAYKYSYAYYYQKDYVLASYYFDRFAKTFPRSDKTEEASFLTAYCKYLESPIYSLDQTNTYEAINGLQLFINAYPNSSRLEESNSLIDELRVKLQKKEFETAKLYLKMRKYKAAVSSFEHLLKSYPDTKMKEDAMYYMIEAYYFYAHKSVRSKREERYAEAMETYNTFIRLYPDSKHNRDIQYMTERARKQLENIEERN